MRVNRSQPLNNLSDFERKSKERKSKFPTLLYPLLMDLCSQGNPLHPHNGLPVWETIYPLLMDLCSLGNHISLLMHLCSLENPLPPPNGLVQSGKPFTPS